MSELDEARRRLVDYRDHVMSEDDGQLPDYQDGYIDGLDYALKLLGHDDV